MKLRHLSSFAFWRSHKFPHGYGRHQYAAALPLNHLKTSKWRLRRRSAVHLECLVSMLTGAAPSRHRTSIEPRPHTISMTGTYLCPGFSVGFRFRRHGTLQLDRKSYVFTAQTLTACKRNSVLAISRLLCLQKAARWEKFPDVRIKICQVYFQIFRVGKCNFSYLCNEHLTTFRMTAFEM